MGRGDGHGAGVDVEQVAQEREPDDRCPHGAACGPGHDRQQQGDGDEERDEVGASVLRDDPRVVTVDAGEEEAECAGDDGERRHQDREASPGFQVVLRGPHGRWAYRPYRHGASRPVTLEPREGALVGPTTTIRVGELRCLSRDTCPGMHDGFEPTRMSSVVLANVMGSPRSPRLAVRQPGSGSADALIGAIGAPWQDRSPWSCHRC